VQSWSIAPNRLVAAIASRVLGSKRSGLPSRTKITSALAISTAVAPPADR